MKKNFSILNPVKGRRILWHGAFWLLQYSISLYNDLYFSGSFSHDFSLLLFLKSALSIFLVLLVKMAATYYLLYQLIPRWIKSPTRLGLYLEGLGLLFIATLCMRLVIQGVVWQLIYSDEPYPNLNFTQLAARFFYSLLDLLQVVALASAIKLFKLRIGAVENEKQLMQEKLRSEILHLKAQVNPHFLFNTLNSIYALARAQAPVAPEAVMRLSKILRYMLYETEQKTTPLRDELALIEDYIQLQQLRFSKRLSIELLQETDNVNAGIAPLLLLPLVENAFKHGSHEGGLIRINLQLKHHQLLFRISNPASFNLAQNSEEGIGLANIRRQLELLYHQASLLIRHEAHTFTVELTIDLSTYAGAELFDRRR